jgi:ammonium transporter, Amt family
VIAGLVAITPACGAVSPVGALVVGAVAGVLCPLAIRLKYRLGYDDSLDVVGVHLVGGVAGTLLVGLLATPEAPSGATGLFYGGGFALLGVQAVAAGAVMAYSFVVTWLLVKLVDKTIGMRLDPEAETDGVDVAEHGEVGWDLDGVPHGHQAGVSERSHEVVASAEAMTVAASGSPATKAGTED